MPGFVPASTVVYNTVSFTDNTAVINAASSILAKRKASPEPLLLSKRPCNNVGQVTSNESGIPRAPGSSQSEPTLSKTEAELGREIEKLKEANWCKSTESTGVSSSTLLSLCLLALGSQLVAGRQHFETMH